MTVFLVSKADKTIFAAQTAKVALFERPSTKRARTRKVSRPTFEVETYRSQTGGGTLTNGIQIYMPP
jgi:hypothetical protein